MCHIVKIHTIVINQFIVAELDSSKSLIRKTVRAEGNNKTRLQMFPCDQCDKEFPQPYRLNRHIREVHVKERRHQCRMCDKGFFKLTSRDRHEMTHEAVGRWKCQKCFKCLKDQSSLKYHEKNEVCVKKNEVEKKS